MSSTYLTFETLFIHSTTFASSSRQTRLHSSSSSLYRARTFNRNSKLRLVRAESQQQDNTQLPLNGGSVQTSMRDILLEYVRNVQPKFMELFVKRAPQQVVDAMHLTNMIRTLPPQFFTVTVTTVSENLAQLMYSVLMTGYMFRNAQYRLELQHSLEQVALPGISEEKKVAPDFAPGTQKKSGEDIRWNNVFSPEKINAIEYIEFLEAGVEELNRQAERISTN